MNKTSIQYADYTWNPLAMRCTKCSPGCDHCWHLGMANRLAGVSAIGERRRAAYRGGPARLLPDELDAPLRKKRPAVIAVQFMGDLFHEAVADDLREAVFDIMARATQHTFLVLTKRPERMARMPAKYIIGDYGELLPHLWLGVSVCNQAEADAKIISPVRWLSIEPMLEAITIAPHVWQWIDWVVCGAESGPGARPMQIEWARALKDQCVGEGVPFFYKQGPSSLSLSTACKDDPSFDCPLIDGQAWRQMPGQEGNSHADL